MSAGRLPAWLDVGLHGLLGGIFVISGLVKAMHPQLLISHLSFRLPWFPGLLAQPTTYLLATVEVLLGIALCTRFHAHRARPATAVLLGVFVVYLLAGMVLGVREPCHCYGQLIQPSPLLSLGIDILLLGGLAVLQRRGTSSTRFAPFALVVSLVLIILCIGRFTTIFDRYLVQTRPGFHLPTLPSLHPEALNRDDDRLVLMVKQVPDQETLSRLQTRFPNRRLVLLTAGPDAERPIVGAQRMVIKPDLAPVFVKTWPTCFTLSSQKIEAVWYGRFPGP